MKDESGPPCVELTGARRRILLGAWWIVLVCGVWLACVWPFEAYRVTCTEVSDARHGNAGTVVTMILGLLAVGCASWALAKRDARTHASAARVLLIALPLFVIERFSMTILFKFKCPVERWQSWIVTPTRDAVLFVTLAGPTLLVLSFALHELEDGRAHIPPARARRPSR